MSKYSDAQTKLAMSHNVCNTALQQMFESLGEAMLAVREEKGVKITDEMDRFARSPEWKMLQGDASKANSEHIRVYVTDKLVSPQQVVILCPTFMRGPLRLRFDEKGHISCASY